MTTTLASTFAAMTSGVGATVAPLIGMATMAAVNMGAKELIKFGMEKAFFGLLRR